jgi:flagellar basal-body rod protein FlgF
LLWHPYCFIEGEKKGALDLKRIAAGANGLVDGSLIQQLRCDTIANNLANLSTKGFKRDILSFDKVLTMKMNSATDFSQGPINQTGNPFDIALQGAGFFKVETEQGARYTRNGAFALDEDNTLVTRSGGHPVMGDGGRITIIGRDVSVGMDGEIRAEGVAVGRISLVDFEDHRVLRKEGGNYYACEGDVEELPVMADTSLHQGAVEESNVDLTREMIRMVEAFRAFETMQKGIQSIDEMTGKLINDSGLF